MRVWIENPFDDLPGDGFRPGRYTLMADAFRAAGHTVTWFTSDFAHTTKRRRTTDDPPIRLVPTRPYARNVSFARIRSHRAYARDWERLALETAASEGAPDLIIVSVPPLATGDVALRLARRFGATLVADAQDLWPETFVRLLPRPLRVLAPLLCAPFARTARRLYRGADLVTGVCDRYRETVLAAGAHDYRRFYLGIRPPLLATRTKPTLHSSTSTLDFDSSSSFVLRLAYAGGLGPTYDLTTALRALAGLPDATLDIAGDGPERAALERTARELGVADRVTFHGRLPAAALAPLLASCDAGLVPMAADSFVGIPNKAADYAAAGLVVLSSLGGECDELLARHGALAAYRAGDAESLAVALATLKANPPMPDFAGLMDELDADRIYADYVRAAEQLHRTTRSRPVHA